jgi:hypothetical protein
MGSGCACQGQLRYRAVAVACIECGADCCPSCTFLFESAPYCASCAAFLLASPDDTAGGRESRVATRSVAAPPRP